MFDDFIYYLESRVILYFEVDFYLFMRFRRYNVRLKQTSLPIGTHYFYVT